MKKVTLGHEQLVRLIGKTLIDKWERHDYQDEKNAYNQGEMNGELSNLLTCEAEETLDDEQRTKLDAYRRYFKFKADYSITTWWDVEVNTCESTHECDDLEEAKAILKGEKDVEQPDPYEQAQNMDFYVCDIQGDPDLCVIVRQMELNKTPEEQYGLKEKLKIWN